MAYYVGIDTSNYTTSAALYDTQSGEIIQSKQLLPVKDGALGLRQSDAVFVHMKQIGERMEQLLPEALPLAGVGVSVRPRDLPGSYMPCFLAGEAVARSVAAAVGAPLFCFSHQAGHIAAALYSAGRLDLFHSRFAAFHLSGGTTDCLIVSPGTDMPFAVTTFATSLDLKAGQAVDRVGGMLGLSFPAGRALEALALTSTKRYQPKIPFKGKDCSLSGIENRCRTMLEKGEAVCDIARFCLDSIRVTVEQMTKDLRETYGAALPILYAGGVMCNSIIRGEITERYGGFFAEPAFSADNAAGITVLAAWSGGTSA